MTDRTLSAAELDAQPIGARWLDALRLESEVDEALVLIFGARVHPDYGESDPATWPCTHLTYDDYDSSFELWGCKDDFEPTRAQVDAALALGFGQCWFVYADSTERFADAKLLTERRTMPTSNTRVSDTKWRVAKLARRTEAAERENALLKRALELLTKTLAEKDTP